MAVEASIEIVVTRADIVTWRRRLDEINTEVHELILEKTKLKEKVKAAEVLFNGEEGNRIIVEGRNK